MCYLEGQTHDQAAEALGCPVGTIRSRLSRGRELLRRRLTRRGYAPTAAILGQGSALPAKLGIEAVSQVLISSTVDAAVAIHVFKTIPAGAAAAPVLALTQGVLTTMKLAQLKWIGMMILATSVAVGGVIAVAYAAGQSPIMARNPMALATPVPASRKSSPICRRATWIHPDKTAPSEATDPFRSNAGLPQPDADSSRAVDLSNRSIRELEVELRLALNDDTRTEILVRDGTIGEKERQQARGKVVLVTARLEGIADDLADEIDRLKLELTKKDAEIERAQAHSLMGAVQVARNKRLNERKAGMVSEDDVATAECNTKSTRHKGPSSGPRRRRSNFEFSSYKSVSVELKRSSSWPTRPANSSHDSLAFVGIHLGRGLAGRTGLDAVPKIA